jgi:NDP-sugar pyrophosphorylase family protein
VAELALIMPMAGRGSRFSAEGERRPKPLIEVAGRPFFWWATQSVLTAAPVRELVFVVLAEHVADHGIDAAILEAYPQARVVAIAEPTAGAAETAAIGVAAHQTVGPLAINDCDHAFSAPGLPALAEALGTGAADAPQVGFASDNPAYSFARLAEDDPTRVLGAVEKQRVGPFAIAGCYLFAHAAVFQDAMARYRDACPYPELFMSGLYDLLCKDGRPVRFQALERHIAFGTPRELAAVSPDALRGLFEGRGA